MAVELATAYVNLIPSARGIVGNIAKELAPVEGAAAATGLRAGSALGGGISSSLGRVLGSLPTASLGPVGTLLGAGLVAGFGAALIGIGKEFGSARRQIIQETGETGAALAGTFDSVKRVFAEVPASLGQVTTAVDLLRQRGTPLGATLDTLAKQELELSKITKTDLGTNVEQTTALFSKFHVSVKDQPAALDAIFKASQQSGSGIATLLDAMKAGSSSLVQFGFGIKESAALIAGLQKAGVNVQPALAGLKKAFGTLVQQGQDPRKALQDLIDEFSNGTAPAKAMGDAIKLFGARSGVELATAIQSGKFSVKDLLATISSGSGGILDTAEKTRTLAERFQILKNQATLALEPLASSVWAQVKVLIGDLVPPAQNLVKAIGELAVAAAPIAAVFGGALLGAFHAVVAVIDPFATGLSTIASVLSLIPGPVLAGVGALVALNAALSSLGAAGGVSAITSFFADLNPVTAGLVIAAGAVTALGVVVKLFSGGASAASKESKELSKSLFDTTTAAGLFKSGITSAAAGLTDFLTKQDSAGKLKDLDGALTDAGFTLKQVGTAIAGTSDQFEGLKATLGDRLGIPQAAQDFAKLTDAQASVLVQTGKVNGSTIDQAEAFRKVTAVIDQQRDAFIKSAEGQLQFAARSGDLNAAQLAAAEKIAIATEGVRGYGAALDFANEAIAENAAKTTQQQIALVSASGGFSQFKADVISGAIGTNDAATAASRFKISLDAAKQVISDTNSALKTFVDQGLAGFPASSDAVNTWSQGVTTAFQAVADAAGKPAKEAAKAKADLLKALDPAQVVAQVQAQAVQIAQFQTNILSLVGKFPNAVRALLSNPDKTAAAQFAQSLVNNPAIAAAFDSAQTTIQSKTASLKALLSGPLAQQFLAGGQADGTAISAGVAETTKIAAPVQTETQKALTVLRQKEAFATAAGDTGAAASFAFQARMLLANSAQAETSKATGALRAGSGPAAAAAGAVATTATGRYGSGLDLGGKTAAALAESQSAWNGQVTVDTANSARAAGRVVGFQFDKGMIDGLSAGEAEAAARAAQVAASMEAAAKRRLGIQSPSKVGIAIGENVVGAIAIGLSRTGPLNAQASRTAGAFVSNLVPGAGDLATLDAATKKLQDLIAAESAQKTATAATDAATAALQQLVSTAVGQLPTAQTQIQAFSSAVQASMQDISSTADAVTKARKKQADDVSKLGGTLELAKQKLFSDASHGADAKTILKDTDAVNRASDALRKQMFIDEDAFTKANAAHIAAQKARDLASDPATFIKNLRASNAQVAGFQADLQKLVGEKFPLVAAELAKAGPETAKKLADALAGSPAQAKLAEAALQQSQTFTASFSDTLTKLFGGTVSTQAATVGAQVGDTIVSGAAGSISAAGDVLWTQLSKPFDGKKITVPTAISDAIKATTHASTIAGTSSVAAATTIGPFTFDLDIEVDGQVLHAQATVPAAPLDPRAATARVLAQARAR